MQLWFIGDDLMPLNFALEIHYCAWLSVFLALLLRLLVFLLFLLTDMQSAVFVGIINSEKSFLFCHVLLSLFWRILWFDLFFEIFIFLLNFNKNFNINKKIKSFLNFVLKILWRQEIKKLKKNCWKQKANAFKELSNKHKTSKSINKTSQII